MAGVKGRSGSGGPRPGSGPKTKLERYPQVFQKADDRLAAAVPDMLDAAIKSALGQIKVAKREKEQEVVYTMPPNPKMLQYLIDRALYKSGTAEGEMLGRARADAVYAEIEAGLPEARALQQRALAADTAMNTWQRKATTPKPDEIKEIFVNVVMGLQFFIQRIPVEQMRDVYCKDDATWQAFLGRFAKEADERLRQQFGKLVEEPPAIEVDFEAET